MTTFIIADNQDITRAGLHSFISLGVEAYRIIDVHTKRELVEKLTDEENAVVVLDYTLFDINGVEEFLIIQKRFPKASWILFSSELSDAFIRRALVEENVGMVLKDNSGEEILLALKSGAKGEKFICHQITNLIITDTIRKEPTNVLTTTETEILRLIAKGMSVKEIAAERVSSTHTVITHKKNIFRKLGVNNVYEATKYALRAGLLEMMEYYI